MSKLFRLECGYQCYDWGKLGSESRVAAFVHNSNPSIVIDSSKPYAELWMGTHPSVPSKCLTADKAAAAAGSNYKTLREAVQENPDGLLAKRVSDKFGSGELPYLFKVLSIRKALSIQAHPDKQLAKVLHARDPKNYPDDNHKPEMAIAITEFEGLCGFRPLQEIAHFLNSIPEFGQVVGEKAKQQFGQTVSSLNNDSGIQGKEALKQLFAALMTCDEKTIASKAEDLIQRAEKAPEAFSTSNGNSYSNGNSGNGKSNTNNNIAELLIRLNQQFPKDIGLFCCLMLNYVRLSPGQAMFLRAKDPHAYISGDIIECMAASDNVVRAGFTPKFKDVDTLVDMLTYTYAPVAEQKMKPEAFARGSGDNANFTLYDPPIDEFSVLETRISGVSGTAVLQGIAGPTITVVTQGHATIRTQDGEQIDVQPGTVYFVAPNTKTEITSQSKDTKEYLSYSAFVEV